MGRPSARKPRGVHQVQVAEVSELARAVLTYPTVSESFLVRAWVICTWC